MRQLLWTQHLRDVRGLEGLRAYIHVLGNG